MMLRRTPLVAVLLLAAWTVHAQEKSKSDKDSKSGSAEPAVKEDPAHEELREVKKAMTDAFNKKDLDALLKYVHKDVVVVWQNGEVSRGQDEIRAYYKRMLGGDSSVLLKVEANPTMKENSKLYGSPATTAVAVGDLNDKYKLRDGTEIDMQSKFSATLVKEEGKWLIVSFHGSANVFQNDVLKYAINRTMWLAGSIGSVVALVLGLILGRVLGGRKAA